MAKWGAKRFWETADVVAVDGGFGVSLDARRLRTPSKGELIVPTHSLAHAITTEWQAQGEKIRPETMPLTRMANSVIDKVRPQREAVAMMLAEYGTTDLVCYRAEGPHDLVQEQAQAWDPLLTWVADFGGVLHVTHGIAPIAQPQATLEVLTQRVLAHDEWHMAPLHDYVTLTGSLVIGLAIADGRLGVEQAWPMSRIEEEWQIRQWGDDEEARELAQSRRSALSNAVLFWAMLNEK